jgi:hypothetical protein
MFFTLRNYYLILQMLNLKSFIFLLVVSLIGYQFSMAQKLGSYDAVHSGVPWFDNNGKLVSAHGANIIKDGNKFYLFGEAHTDTSNAFAGFNCYSSADLYNWKFERIALPVQSSGMLGPGKVGERAKVMKCAETGEYIMFMHSDTLGYKDPYVAFATSKNITGPYVFRGPLLFKGKPVQKWDMGTYQDTDGAGYLIIHGGLLYKLSDDYKSIAALIIDNKWRGSESPAIFKKAGTYFWLASDLTSWERNDNFYYTATSLKGPWTARGNFAPKGTLTWNSQTTYVLPIIGNKDTTYLFMGDRWSYPYQASSATYVWQPMNVSGTTISIPTYRDAWQSNTSTGQVTSVGIGNKLYKHTNKSIIKYRGRWQHIQSDTMSASRSDVTGDSFSVRFTGRQIGFLGFAGVDGGYAAVKITNRKGINILTTMVDLYSKYSEKTLLFLTPVMKSDTYTLTVSVLGKHGNWTDKKKTVYGSKGNFVSVADIVVK